MNHALSNNLLKIEADRPVSSTTFKLYILFTISFFIHLPARIPGIGVLRPDLLLVLIIVFLLVMQRDQLKGRNDLPTGKILMFLMMYSVISVPFVEWPGSVLKSNIPTFIKAVIFFYFTVYIIDTDKRLKIFVAVFAGCQVFRIIEPLYLHITTGYWGSHTHLGGGEFMNRLSGAPSDIVNPNGLAFIIALVFPFLHYLLLPYSFKHKVLYLALLPPLLLTLVLTASRSGFVALAIVGIAIFLKSSRKFLLIMVGVVGIAVAFANLTDLQKERYLSLTGDENVRGADTSAGRVRGMLADFELALERPIFGFGLGTSKEAITHSRGVVKISHTLYAEVMIELGVIGLIIYLVFLKSVLNNIKANNRLMTKLQDNPDGSEQLRYYKNLTDAMQVCFWMNFIFSFAYFGVSRFHWYLLAGLSVVAHRFFLKKIEMLERESPENIETDSQRKISV